MGRQAQCHLSFVNCLYAFLVTSSNHLNILNSLALISRPAGDSGEAQLILSLCIEVKCSVFVNVPVPAGLDGVCRCDSFRPEVLFVCVGGLSNLSWDIEWICRLTAECLLLANVWIHMAFELCQPPGLLTSSYVPLDCFAWLNWNGSYQQLVYSFLYLF